MILYKLNMSITEDDSYSAKRGIYLNIIDKSGFTLIELIVVLLIISILSALVLPNIFSYLHSAQQIHIY